MINKKILIIGASVGALIISSAFTIFKTNDFDKYIQVSSYGREWHEMVKDPMLNKQETIDRFAWDLFLAINKPGRRDEGRKFTSIELLDLTATYGGPYTQTIWETMLNMGELENNSIMIRPDKKIIATVNKESGHNIVIGQADKNWLVDQNGNLVWYEIRLNHIGGQFIRTNTLYGKKGIENYVAADHDQIWLPEQTIEIKAAWKELTEDEYNSGKFKTTITELPKTVSVKNGPNNDDIKVIEYKTDLLDRKVKMGLVGLHIIKKTANAPQFIWMTFEHNDNAPAKGEGLKETYSFYKKDSRKIPNTPPEFGDISTPIQVVREKAIRSELQKINEEYQKKAPGVWKNYQLVEAMWPESPLADKDNRTLPLSDGGATPILAANTTMETYVQQTRNCMSCHNKAQVNVNSKKISTDYSFIISLLYNAKK